MTEGTRRNFVRAVCGTASLVGVAGCSGGGNDRSGGTTGSTGEDGDGSPTATDPAPAGSSTLTATATPTAEDAPEVRLEWYDAPEDGTVAATHTGGDVIDGANLQYACGGETHPVEDGTYSAGQTVFEPEGCPARGTVKLVWTSPESGRPKVLFSGTVPPRIRVDWSEPSDGKLVAVHAGGNTVQGENLQYSCSAGDFEVDPGTYEAGDTIVESTDCAPGGKVSLRWEFPDDELVTLDTYQMPI